MVGITVIAVCLVAAPLAYVLDRLADDAAQIRLQRQTEGVALALEDELSGGRLPSSDEVDRLTPAGDHTLVVLDGVGTVDGGEPVARRALRSEIRVAPGATVEVEAPAQPIDDQVERAVKILLALAAVAMSVAAALAVVQGRRLARPLEALAHTSRRLGRGDFSATAPRCGVREIDDVAAALDATSERIGRLVRAEREFSNNASHQLRSALTGVSLHLEAIGASDDPGVRRESDDALEQIDRLTAVIDELLRLARRGRSGELREVDLAGLASEHAADWTKRFAREGRDLRLDVPSSALVTVTPGAAGQALDILLSNALVHGAGTTAVRVEVRPTGAEIVVTDEGRGIAPGEQDRAFERAERTDGHGLGLALARELVTADGGSLDLVAPAASPSPPAAVAYDACRGRGGVAVQLVVDGSASPAARPEARRARGWPWRGTRHRWRSRRTGRASAAAVLRPACIVRGTWARARAARVVGSQLRTFPPPEKVTMVNRFAHLATRRPKRILLLAVIGFLVAGAIGGGVAEHLTVGGFVDPASESGRAEKLLADQFDTGAPNVVLLVTARDGTVDDADVATAGAALTATLASEPGVDGVVSYWSENDAPPLRSKDGTRALVLGRIDSEDADVINKRIEELAPRLRAEGDGTPLKVEVGGFAEVYRELGATIEEDLVTAEMIALPITLLLLVLFFGSVVAGLLPLATALLSVVGTLLVLRLLTLVTDVSVYSLSLTTALGLGLAIDYSLFIVARYREELRRRPDDPREAVVATVRSAGRTVAFSSLTVAASLCAMLLFPMGFLHSFAFAGVAVSLLAGLFSVLVLPAILALLGHKVNALTLWKRSVVPPEEGLWHRVATFVMRRPLPVATGVILVLLFLGAPFLGLHMTQPDERVLSESSRSRQVHDVIREEFSSTEEGALSVVASSAGATSEDEVGAYAARLAALPGVARVDAATGSYCGTGMVDEFGCTPGDLLVDPSTSDRYAGFTAGGGTYLSVVPAVAPLSDAGEDLVSEIRTAPAPFDVLVTGPGAELVDTNDSLLDRLPLALGVIAAITVVLLFMMFGSVVIPLKAVVLNLLSLSATFGAMVWIFQDGHLSELLDFTATGGISASMPIMMFCIAFGLSMDYEVFLLSRIKEEHDRGADNVKAVTVGLERTGRIVTAAAVLMSVVFLAFVSSRVSFIKLYGLGLTLAVLLDAFVIRGTLVPAFMRLAGRWNWWAPGPLRRFYDRYGIRDHGASEASDPDPDPEPDPDAVEPAEAVRGPAPSSMVPS